MSADDRFRGVGDLIEAPGGNDGLLAEAGTYGSGRAQSDAQTAQVPASFASSTVPDIADLPVDAPDVETFASLLDGSICSQILDNRISDYRPYDFAPVDSVCRQTDDPNRRRRRGPDLAALVAAAFDRAVSLAPAPELDMAPRRIGLTGLPTYVWDDDPPPPVIATASAGGITVTAEARVTHYRWDFGDDVDLSTNSGRPWTGTRPGTIEHIYETKGFYDVSAEAIWAARWRIGGGAWQSLGYFSTSDSRRYPVQEVVSRLVPMSNS
ncbi:MAG: PKD domain-containing protein [Actinomycetota bacterium]